MWCKYVIVRMGASNKSKTYTIGHDLLTFICRPCYGAASDLRHNEWSHLSQVGDISGQRGRDAFMLWCWWGKGVGCKRARWRAEKMMTGTVLMWMLGEKKEGIVSVNSIDNWTVQLQFAISELCTFDSVDAPWWIRLSRRRPAGWTPVRRPEKMTTRLWWCGAKRRNGVSEYDW